MLLALDAPLTDRGDGLFIREAHHRIANSLQLACSFLHLRARRAATREVRNELAEIATRINAVGLLHRRLCHTESGAFVDLRAYVHVLCAELGASVIGGNGAEFRTDAQGGAELHLDSQAASVIGIILTELLTNCVKHAGEKPVCSVGISRVGDSLRLAVSDNGPGFPADRSLSDGAGIGLEVVRSLIRQLNGTIELLPMTHGAHVVVSVPLERAALIARDVDSPDRGAGRRSLVVKHDA
jgi:two-component system, sensor histidine kinase PdtaS